MSSHLKRIFDLYENGSNYIEIKYKIYLEKGILYSINEIKDILYPPNKSSSQLIKENTKSEFSQLIPNLSLIHI